MFFQFLTRTLALTMFLPYVCWTSIFGKNEHLNKVSFLSILAVIGVVNFIFLFFSFELVNEGSFFTDKDIGKILMVKAANVSSDKTTGDEKMRSNLVINSGQTLSHILGELGIGSRQIFAITNNDKIKGITLISGQTVRTVYNCNIQYKESEIDSAFAKDSFCPPRYRMCKNCVIHEMQIPLKDKVLVYKNNNGSHVVDLKKLNTKKVYRIVRDKVHSNLYGDALRNNVPVGIISKMLKEYSYILDFQRDIRQNDTFSLIFEEIRSENDELIRHGDLLFADIVLQGRNHQVYLFKNQYYNEKGESIKKTILKTPIDGARISSNFGRRTHPVLGYTREHRGIDFAAPTGTPIYSAGDGVVEFVGLKSGYGNFITIRHNKELKTNYAHLSKFGKIKKGGKVVQRDIIGYVGSTGMVTGPHLHFEMVVMGKKVNPKSRYLNESKKLNYAEMSKFNKFKKDIAKAFSS
ncbi:MAG: M23 family metallopeptidase [Alphaproteobacteria bacterium]|nr:M23 family metallopeptidase [Rickettsiales bacterium]